jgi:hypothetical protein
MNLDKLGNIYRGAKTVKTVAELAYLTGYRVGKLSARRKKRKKK